MRKMIALLLTVLMMIPAVSLADGAVTLTVNNVMENENAFGRCVVPEGYQIAYRLDTCTLDQSVAYPNMLTISAGKQGGPQMVYISARDYIAGTDKGAEKQDGQFNTDFQTPVLHYMSADEYNDYLAENTFARMADNGLLTPEGTKQYPEVEEKFRQLMEPAAIEWNASLGIFNGGVSDLRTSVWMNGYSFTMGGQTYHALVLTGNAGVWIYTDGVRRITWVNWVVPFTFAMYAPDTDTEAADAFMLFVNNTVTSDQFSKANRDMSAALWEQILKAHDIRDCYQYSYRTIREATSEGGDYNEDRITDYIFDQNDYTLEDGSHVKVSTGYDYVWEGDNGNIYVSNSLFDQPGGSRQLYPNP